MGIQTRPGRRWEPSAVQDRQENSYPLLQYLTRSVLQFHASRRLHRCGAWTAWQYRGTSDRDPIKVQAEQDRLACLEAARATAEAEIEDLEDHKIATQAEAKRAADRLNKLAPAVKSMEKLAREFSDDPEQILPEVATLESARNYREKKAKPLLAKIVKVLRSVYYAYLDLRSRFERLQQSYNRECSKTAQMGERVDALVSENKMLRGIAADFDRAKKALGKDKVETAVESMKLQEAMMKAQKKKQQQYSR